MSDSDKIEYAAQTDVGLKRTHNEDAIVVCPERAMVILADGMGGYNAGEVASEIATRVIKDYVNEQLLSLVPDSSPCWINDVEHIVSESVKLANTTVFEAALAAPKYFGMGTTLVMALCHGNTLVVAHVGDSRAYCFSQGRLVQITRDHSVVQEQVDAGNMTAEAAWNSNLKNLVTRAIGVTYSVLPEITLHQIKADDIYLLCSDGLSDMVKGQTIERTLQKKEPASLQEMADELIALANSKGGSDNISVVLFKLKKPH